MCACVDTYVLVSERIGVTVGYEMANVGTGN